MYLHSVPVYRYDTSRTATPEVGDYSTVRFEKNNYSVPVRYLRRTVTVKGYADKVLIMYNGKLIATHDRLFGSSKTSYRLEHYIDLLERKPRSVFQAKPVRDTVAEELIDWGKKLPGGNSEMVKLLRLCVDHGEEKILAVKHSLPSGIIPTVDIIRTHLHKPAETNLIHMSNDIEVADPDLVRFDAVVFMDAIHYHVRSEGRIVKRAVYIALGIDMNGKKDVLGMYVGENESAKFWLSIMNGLKNRGVEDILIACVDGLNGFPQAIEAVYPKTEIQQCIIHQIRNSTKFVSYKDIKKLMADLKLVYAAPTEETALNELELLKDKWDSKYPKIYKSWYDNWATLSTYFKYPEAVRRLIYTTNAIEGFNRQLRKVTKSKTVFPSDDSLLKMLYLATMDITKKWTGHRQDWGQIHSQLEIYFEERLIGRNL